jgi:hypothetical protein
VKNVNACCAVLLCGLDAEEEEEENSGMVQDGGEGIRGERMAPFSFQKEGKLSRPSTLSCQPIELSENARVATACILH